MKDHQPMSPNKSFEGLDIAERAGRGLQGLNIIDVILRDHINLKNLIPVLKNPEIRRDQKAQTCEDFVFYLQEHSIAEQESLYVHMKEHTELKVDSFEGDTSHALATQLIQEINATADDDEWVAKVKVLAELVEHHIDEEEKDDGMLDHIGAMEESMLLAVGGEYERIKKEFDSLNAIRPARLQKFTLAH